MNVHSYSVDFPTTAQRLLTTDWLLATDWKLSYTYFLQLYIATSLAAVPSTCTAELSAASGGRQLIWENYVFLL